MLNFDVLENRVVIVSLPYFAYNFSRKMFLMLYFINWPNFITWLSFLLEILVNMCIAAVCEAGYDVIDSEINLIFLIKPFSYYQKVKTKI